MKVLTDIPNNGELAEQAKLVEQYSNEAENEIVEKEIPEDAEVTEYPKYWLPSGVYDVLKWVGLAGLPTLSWAYSALAATWDLPYAGEVSTTLAMLGTLIAVLIGASQISAYKRYRRVISRWRPIQMGD